MNYFFYLLIALAIAGQCQAQENAAGASEGGAPEPYAYGYEAPDHSAAEERTPEGKVQGYYTLKDADGRSRRVQYYADESGFHANVETNELGQKTSNPADVQILASPPTQEQLLYTQHHTVTQEAPHHAQQLVVQPGQQQSTQLVVEPGQQQSTQLVVQPGQQQSAQWVVQPGQQQSTQLVVQPGQQQSAQWVVQPGQQQLILQPGQQQSWISSQQVRPQSVSYTVASQQPSWNAAYLSSNSLSSVAPSYSLGRVIQGYGLGGVSEGYNYHTPSSYYLARSSNLVRPVSVSQANGVVSSVPSTSAAYYRSVSTPTVVSLQSVPGSVGGSSSASSSSLSGSSNYQIIQ